MLYEKEITIILPLVNETASNNCLVSIFNNTKDLDNIEIICPNTFGKTFSQDFNFTNIKYLNVNSQNVFDLLNAGIKESKGKYIILLNEDIEIINSEWINVFKKEVENNEICGVTIQEIKDTKFMYLYPSIISSDLLNNYKFDNSFTIDEFGFMDFCDNLIHNKKIIKYFENTICKYTNTEKDIPSSVINSSLIRFKRNKFLRKSNKNVDVLVEIITSNRAHSTLPMALSSLINQTFKPRVVLILWNGQEEFFPDKPQFKHLSDIIKILEKNEIEVIILNSDTDHISKKHQFALETNRNNIQCEFIFRLDDDCVLESDNIEILYKTLKNNKNCYGVAPLIIDPQQDIDLNSAKISSKIEWIFDSINEQWIDVKRGILNVDHLYSSFMYRDIEPDKINYDITLSPISHREETLFTYNMKKLGYSLLVNTDTKMWHCRNVIGGNRKYTKKESEDFILEDEKVFQKALDLKKK